jgi:flagellar export protein FliJ
MSRIDAVLRIRRVQESMAKAVLAQANHALVEASANEGAWRESLQQWGAKREPLSSGSFRAWRSTLTSANRDLQQLEQRTLATATKQGEALDLLIDASMRVDVLERLDERLNEAAQAEEMRSEQSTIDEIAITMYAKTAAPDPMDKPRTKAPA